MPCGLSFHQQTEPSSGPSVVHLLASRSLAHQLWSSRVWNIRSSGFCSFVAFGAPSLSLLTPAGAAIPLTIVATTGQLVGGQGCWGVEGSFGNRSSPRQLRGREAGLGQCARG